MWVQNPASTSKRQNKSIEASSPPLGVRVLQDNQRDRIRTRAVGEGDHHMHAMSPETRASEGAVSSPSRRARVFKILREVAAKAVGEGDPWKKHNLHLVPAERVIRHLYNPETESWSTDETIVKIEPEAFTNGAMRYCYRMKKRAQPPRSASNHHFHKFGWQYALNYVAKAYHKDGKIDTSEEAKCAIKLDIQLQYEATFWAEKFNQSNPPAKIHFIRAYAVEFPDREGKPWFAVERFITGTDRYGAGYVKHNTNAGFVDTELHRVTPQVFSAHSFFASQGQRLVADIQGVGDLYTDPQILSSDYRFGDGDLGPRGMALFFKNFRHCGVSDALGILIFPLSRNEIKNQAKYDEDEETLSDEEASVEDSLMNSLQKLDANRVRRGSMLMSPRDLFPPDRRDTMKRSNITSPAKVRQTVRASLRMTSPPIHHLKRSKSDVDEVSLCLQRARNDLKFTHHSFHRKASGELKERHFKNNDSDNDANGERKFRRSQVVRAVSAPIVPTDETRKNMGKVHYQLAVLHGMGRFPDVVPDDEDRAESEQPSHDSFSVLFHLSYASALHNAPALLSMARVHAGMETCVSDLLKLIVPTDFEAAKDLLRRAMESPYPPAAPKAAAGCLLLQILHEERDLPAEATTETSNEVMMQVLMDTINLMEQTATETADAKKHQEKEPSVTVSYHKHDRVEADYAMEGTYYSATVTEVSEDGEQITVCYDDDGSEECLPKHHVRTLVPPTATQTATGGPLSDEEAFGSEGSDESFLLKVYELQAELAQLKEKTGDLVEASALYQLAADGAMNDRKMKVATEWSLKAAELQQQDM